MCGKLLTFILVLVFLAGITHAEQVDQTVSDPIHWWRLDDANGLAVADSGTIGTLNGLLEAEPDEPNWVAGRLDFALDFGFVIDKTSCNDGFGFNHVEFLAQPNLGDPTGQVSRCFLCIRHLIPYLLHQEVYPNPLRCG